MSTFDQHRRLLFAVAYRILGSATDAEDAVQEAWLRWSAADRSEVADPKAYLARIVTRQALDQLRAARHERETYIGPWLPEPTEKDDISTALLVVLETLSPIERAVFVLKDIFDFPYGEIAAAVDRSEQAVRQSAHRAREHVRARRPRFRADQRHQRDVTDRFLAAAAGGDINGLLQVLAPDVTLWTDGGGKVRQARKPVSGAPRVAAWMAAVAGSPYEGIAPADMRAEVVELNGTAGVLFTGAGRVVATLTFDLDESGLIRAVYNVANPGKLRALRRG
ncbi:DNA-directed RNA polymerase sigma-70 factor [Paractinoplanes abujensis]|uniref:RNA polymerase sigma-70 factor (ECF subfamily) n=1 Tax=Paractinoplanes abujensis TaxID=882441 RepID=A0A7W7CTE5_9ACTN|nr:RNA polymerase sigma factor SigJ [Actinoplanes abujensis]MBB4694039.1 RNA polymerase sigma-70 factor (ECF subfamily) [Actinoplanes abujensis]GID21303.1 DNA-directed RNA polymerase sigma-70 factor [Actinoplanes abujensis]